MTIGPAPDSIKPDAPKDQRAHQALAEIGFGDQQRAQAIGGNRHGLDVGQRLLVDEIWPARQLCELAHEIAALVRDDVRRLAAVRLGDVDLARQDQHQSGPDLADPREHFALLVAARFTESGEPRNFIVGEAQEHLRSTGRVGIAELIRHDPLVSARKERMAFIVASGCSSISQ